MTLETQNSRLKTQDERWKRAAWVCAAMAGLFCAVLTILLVTTLVRDKVENPLVSDKLTAMKQALATRGADQGLEQDIQAEDLRIRSDYWQRRAGLERGAWLLLGGGIVLVVAIKAGRLLGKARPALEDVKTQRTVSVAAARWAVVGAGVAMASLLVTATMAGRAVGTITRVTATVETPGPVAATPFPTWEQMGQNWPVFRGWGASGIVGKGPWPMAWNGETGQNVVWKTEVPLPGHSSPVVWGDKVFLSGATADKREVYCFTTADGRLLWRGDVPRTGQGELNLAEDTGYAPSTLATDGSRVYAIFVTGDIAAFDLAGKKLWQRNMAGAGVPESTYGYASSLTVWDNKVIVQWDVGQEDEEGKSKSALIALDGATGKVTWQTRRPVANGWSSPTVVKTPTGSAIVTSGQPWVIMYDAATGKETWRAKLLENDVAPMPVYADGVVYVANANAVIAAIKADGKGNVTDTHVRWKVADEGQPDTVSPIVADGLLFTVTADGTIWCWDAMDGKKLWTKRYKREFKASPLVVDGKLGVVDTKGTMHWLKLRREAVELGTAELGEMVTASPAFVGGRVYLRGKTSLFCIGATGGGK